MAEPMLTIGELYQIRDDHPHWPGRPGIFAFMGGPDKDVVVMEAIPEDFSIEEAISGPRTYFCVKPMDVALHLSAA